MNDFSTNADKQRRAIMITAIVGLLIVGFLIYKGWDNVVNNEIDQTVIVTGSFTCLPLKSGEDSEDSCVLGVKSRDEKFYALDIARIQDANTDLKAEDTIAVTGWLQPQDEIAGSDWEEFAIDGIILVNTLLRTR